MNDTSTYGAAIAFKKSNPPDCSAGKNLSVLKPFSSAASTWRSTGGAGHPTNSRGVGRVARLAGEAIGIVGDGPRVVIERQGYADHAKR